MQNQYSQAPQQYGNQNANSFMADDDDLDMNAVLGPDTGSDFILLPKGDYDFIVSSWSQEEYVDKQSNNKPRKRMVINLQIQDPETGKTVSIKESIPLKKKLAFKFSQLFTSVGDLGKDSEKAMDWETLNGKGGRLSLSHREYNGKQYHNVDSFLPPDTQAQATQPAPQFTQQPVQQPVQQNVQQPVQQIQNPQNLPPANNAQGGWGNFQ